MVYLCQRDDLVTEQLGSPSNDIVGIIVSYLQLTDIEEFAKINKRCANIVYEKGSEVCILVSPQSKQRQEERYSKLCKNISTSIPSDYYEYPFDYD